jgi:hypothetical protein
MYRGGYMRDDQELILNEICWIVDKRNAWAKRRMHYRNKLRSIAIADPRYQDVLSKYIEVNRERTSINVHTKRLRALLKSIQAKLVSDQNAGYQRIDIYLDDGRCTSISREEIAHHAREHEMDIYMAQLFTMAG